jgi:hypothetical protein
LVGQFAAHDHARDHVLAVGGTSWRSLPSSSSTESPGASWAGRRKWSRRRRRRQACVVMISARWAQFDRQPAGGADLGPWVTAARRSGRPGACHAARQRLAANLRRGKFNAPRSCPRAGLPAVFAMVAGPGCG